MNIKQDYVTRDFTKMLCSLATFILVMALLFLTNCDRDHPHEPPVIAPPDTVIVIDTVFVIRTVIIHDHHNHPVVCDTFHLTIEFTVVGDRSAPNVYAYFRNGVEAGRFVVSETYAEPTDIFFQVVFERITLGDVITIKKIEGSRAETIGSAIVGIRCSS